MACHNYWSLYAREPTLCHRRGHRNEKPANRNQELAPAHHNQRRSSSSSEDPTWQKINKQLFFLKEEFVQLVYVQLGHVLNMQVTHYQGDESPPTSYSQMIQIGDTHTHTHTHTRTHIHTLTHTQIHTHTLTHTHIHTHTQTHTHTNTHTHSHTHTHIHKHTHTHTHTHTNAHTVHISKWNKILSISKSSFRGT